MTYRIRISYRTGNSFGCEDVEKDLEMTWDSQEIARDNLRRIREHQEYSELGNSWSSKYSNMSKKERAALERAYEAKDWFVDSDEALNCIKLKTDEGKDWQIGCFWVGWFETLYGASIVDNQELDRFTTGRY